MMSLGSKYGMTSIVAVATVLVTAPAAAQTRSFNVPAQAAEKAIPLFAKQAGVPILASGKVVRGKQTRAVQGEHSIDEALAILLQGTGLKVQRAGDGRGMITIVSASAPGNASGAANGGAQQGQATLVGSVRDHKTGSALKGARVEVVETGANTSTGDLGDFRFTRLPTGDVTLRISYLGFPEQTETVSVVGGLNNRTDIYLGSGATSEIVVIGQVSARAQALNQERTAENSTTVISGDLLGNFNGTTISDALRRAPGVSFQMDPVTGDGTNIIVRGLSPDYNQVKLNGVALPEPEGTGRSANLSNILADSISEVRISKTLSAKQDSGGTGGLVEIETKSPLDRPRRYFNLSADGTKRAKGFGDEYLLSGTASMRFGADGNFGISGSYQHRRQDITTYTYNVQGVFGPYLPLGPNGQPANITEIDPLTPFPFYDGADYYTTQGSVGYNRSESTTDNLTLSAEWQVSAGTNLKFDYVRSVRTLSYLANSLNIRSTLGVYTLKPVPALDGEQRYVYGDLLPRVNTINSVAFNDGDRQKTDALSFRGTSAFGALTLDYMAGYSRGATRRPSNGSFFFSRFVPVNAANVGPDAIDPATGTIVTLFGPRSGRGLPQPLLTAAGFAGLANAVPQGGDVSYSLDTRGRSSNRSGEVGAKYEFGPGLLQYVEAGFQYRGSSFKNIRGTSASYIPNRDGPAPFPQVTELGLEFEGVPFDRVGGSDTAYQLFSESSIRGFLASLGGLADNGTYQYFEGSNDAIYDDVYTDEDDLAAYLQARIDIGKVEIIPGLRIDRNRVEANFANGVTLLREDGSSDEELYLATRKIQRGTDVLTSYLPRILVNYRPTEKLVFRAGYYSTVARPLIEQLNAERNITYYDVRAFGPTFSQTFLSVFEGDPALKPARTHNFDIGGEWYDDNVGTLKFNLFLKRIANLIENNNIRGSSVLDEIELPDHPVFNNLPDDVYVEYSKPVNNPDVATIWGFELAFEKRLTFLPGFLSGLGVYANYAFSDSEKVYTDNWLAPVYDTDGAIIDYRTTEYQRNIRFNQSPSHSGTVGLTYSGSGIDASLYYTRQARLQTAAQRYFLDSFIEPIDSLDFRGVYSFTLGGADMRLSVEALDLLKGRSDPRSEESIGGVNGSPKYYTGGYYQGGRRFAVGLSATF
jgi:TonB-dependent receptor